MPTVYLFARAHDLPFPQRDSWQAPFLRHPEHKPFRRQRRDDSRARERVSSIGGLASA
jgi:hypothetical protein